MARLRVLPPANAAASAEAAGLVYTADRKSGIRRLRNGKTFRYLDPHGRPVSRADRARIKALAIPPAWRDVWICTSPRGHLQATGRDARGRKQYRYHPKWRQIRDETKYGRLIAFGRALASIRRRVETDLRRSGLPREKVLAAVVELLGKTFIRVGNEEYARTNHSFGLTTMRDRHVKISGSTVRFIFRGKSGIEHALELDDRRLAKIVRQCRDLPGQELFEYRGEDGSVVGVGSSDVNAYLKDATGQDFTSKDFRTWAGTVLACSRLRKIGAPSSAREGKRAIVRAIEDVAKRLGNTRAVCRKCYVHPAVLDAYLDGTIADAPTARASSGLTAAEMAVLRLLQRRSAREPDRRAS